MLKKYFVIILAILISISSNVVLTNASVQTFEKEIDILNIVENKLEIINADDSNLPDNDELFKGYVNKAFGIEDIATYNNPTGNRLAKNNLAGNRLSGNDKIIYDFLKEKIAQVASGEISDTDFEIPMSSLIGYQQKWSKEELGVEIVENNKFNEAVFNAIWQKMKQKLSYNFRRIYNAILSDFPYELYWHNKTLGYAADWFGSYSYTAYEFTLKDNVCISFSLTVDPTYAATDEFGNKEEYKTDSSKLSSIPVAVANAKSIVEEAKTKTDYEKLLYYRKEIRHLTEYNNDAVSQDGYSKININPWQLIYVFDGNPETKVVCEGFSKAFQYLCDETEFNNKHIVSYIVSGIMTRRTDTGLHMWNLIHIGSKGNYLIDVTNAPADNVRFLSGYSSKKDDITYVFNYPDYTGDDGKEYYGGSATYEFDEGTISTFSKEQLDIAAGYGPLTEEDFQNIDDNHVEETIITEATCTEAGEEKFVCLWCGETTNIRTINPLGHTWDSGKVTKEPSCTDGEKIYTCTVCGEKETEIIAATDDHTWNSGVVTKEPSCADGEKIYTCTVCGEEKFETIAATDKHTWDNGVVTKKPSCLDGEKTYNCTACGEKRTETIAATGEHAWGEYIIEQEPTYTEIGTKKRICTICNENENVTTEMKTNSDGSVTTIETKVNDKENVVVDKKYSISIEKVIENGNTVSITRNIIEQIVEATGQNDININFNVKNSVGSEKFTIIANIKDLSAGNNLYIYQYNEKTGEYIIANDKTYTVNSEGDVAISMEEQQTYRLVSTEEATGINKAILKTVKVKNSSVTIKSGKTKNIEFSSELNLGNVKKVTYSTSKKSVATVSYNGKITAKKKGTTTVKVNVALKNGSKKTVSLKVKVK